MHRGYVRLWRKIQDNPLWKERRVFSKAEAWLDILMEAQHSEEDQRVIIGNTILVCRQGECLKSTRTWAKRWNWSEHKVRLFFDLMLKSGNLDAVNEGKTTRLIVLNYSLYNEARRSSDADCDARATHARRTKGDRQECKECKNEKPLVGSDEKTRSDNGRKSSIPYQEIISYLNEKSGKNFRHTTRDTQKHISARWDQGFRLDDFKRVIDVKCSHWLKDPERFEYLRPQTLFGPKFESYLNSQAREEDNNPYGSLGL